jgi:hypothetical protein
LDYGIVHQHTIAVTQAMQEQLLIVIGVNDNCIGY